MSLYSREKVLKHFDSLAKLCSGQAVAPIHLRLHLYGSRNFNCGFCNYKTKMQESFISYDISCLMTF